MLTGINSERSESPATYLMGAYRWRNNR